MEQEGTKIYDNFIYYGHNTWLPAIGDVRIKYEFAGMTDPTNPTHVRTKKYSSIICCFVTVAAS